MIQLSGLDPAGGQGALAAGSHTGGAYERRFQPGPASSSGKANSTADPDMSQPTGAERLSEATRRSNSPNSSAGSSSDSPIGTPLRSGTQIGSGTIASGKGNSPDKNLDLSMLAAVLAWIGEDDMKLAELDNAWETNEQAKELQDLAKFMQKTLPTLLEMRKYSNQMSLRDLKDAWKIAQQESAGAA